ncbi:MAG: type II toxin-antitoxin system RelE/ParE family toxin [Mucilaginibacter sp.]
MSLAIVWTDEATTTFDDTVIQIESKWRNPSAEKFVKAAHKIINSISNQPYLFKASHNENVRQAVITGQTSMFYEVHSSHIVILFF